MNFSISNFSDFKSTKHSFTKVLRYPISTLYSMFISYYPQIHITYQAFRSMIPPYIAKKTKDIDEGEISPSNRKRRGRPHKNNLYSNGDDDDDELEQHSNDSENAPKMKSQYILDAPDSTDINF